ncbi:hypothetical protein PISL3812_09348 [Talaromyces islandicus]|uniref:Uncharacterized protein n=1 Tax=Talaromyces islandicus TaxID=28573 RepID=A0A0U1MB40_TALIS|nr:hypothetical protein PISL3812_09348 [Talaromyces islandicus]
MALRIPENGLSLWRGDQPGHASPDPNSKPTQIMRLNLAQNTVDELVDSLRKDQKARLRLGKHQTLYYGSKSQHFHASVAHHRSELYRVNPSDRENLYFSGVLSHSIEVQRAKEATASADEALATLEQSMSAFERGKESKKTQLVNLKPDGRRSLTKGPPSKTDLEKERFFNNRSLPNSPSLGGIRSPASVSALTPTSAPLSQNKRKVRLDALKVPFLHLLAVTPVSIKYLAQTTRSSQDDCQELARKYAVQTGIDDSKYKLKDRTYKELDIWNFPYPNESDRNSAIENAISAFDRQRISTSDKLWQMLNSKEEKAKGICKSRLKLQTGPQPPQIKVHASEETAKEAGKDETMTGHETDRTNGRLTPTAAGVASARITQPKKKSAPAKSNNSTLTGRITKKTDKKAPAKPDGKFKSAEFVHDSDEDLDIPDAPPPPPPPAPSKKPSTETSKPASKLKIETKPAATKTPTATRSPAIKSQVTMEPRPRSLKKVPANSNSTSLKTLPGTRQTKPTSPTKPSPLASSPPTNASDFENSTQNSGGQTSSSSSSPLMAQVSRQPKARPTTTAKPKEVARPTGTIKPPPNTLKRKTLAEPTPTGRMNGDNIKRRRPLHSPSGTSSGSASPPLSRDNRLQRLQEKSIEFKKLYSKYRTLHDSLAKQTDPTPSDLSRLRQMHARVSRLKEDIWEEDRRLR